MLLCSELFRGEFLWLEKFCIRQSVSNIFTTCTPGFFKDKSLFVLLLPNHVLSPCKRHFPQHTYVLAGRGKWQHMCIIKDSHRQLQFRVTDASPTTRQPIPLLRFVVCGVLVLWFEVFHWILSRNNVCFHVFQDSIFVLGLSAFQNALHQAYALQHLNTLWESVNAEFKITSLTP